MNELSCLCVLAMYILHCKTKRVLLLGELTFLLRLLFGKRFFFKTRKFFSEKRKERRLGEGSLNLVLLHRCFNVCLFVMHCLRSEHRDSYSEAYVVACNAVGRVDVDDNC